MKFDNWLRWGENTGDAIVKRIDRSYDNFYGEHSISGYKEKNGRGVEISAGIFIIGYIENYDWNVGSLFVEINREK